MKQDISLGGVSSVFERYLSSRQRLLIYFLKGKGHKRSRFMC